MSAHLQHVFSQASDTNPSVVAVARGDGIGPEITDAVLHVLREADCDLDFDMLEVGERAYLQGASAGISQAAWESIAAHKVLLKGPVTTPQGGGYKSVNVTLRKTLGLYANVRPCVAYAPFMSTAHPGMDVVIVRENEEDTCGGIEHRQTDEVVQCLKLISRPGCERVIRYAFEYARAHGRRKVSCFTKDNIMKLTDGLFHRVFDEVAAQYSELQHEHRIIDIGAARLATRPRDFDVIVTLNLYGDILSDIGAEIAGSIGMAASANIGRDCAMFEAVHGSAPDIAGKNIANPSGLLLAAVMMLAHIGRHEAAERIHNAWLATIEDGLHTADLFNEVSSRRCVGTREFAHAVAVAVRLGREPHHLPPVRYPERAATRHQPLPSPSVTPSVKCEVKRRVGVDLFLDWDQSGRDSAVLAGILQSVAAPDFQLSVITNRGVRVWPGGMPQTFCTDHWRCRFLAADGDANPAKVMALMQRVFATDLEIIKSEHLYTFDGERGYSVAQGE